MILGEPERSMETPERLTLGWRLSESRPAVTHITATMNLRTTVETRLPPPTVEERSERTIPPVNAQNGDDQP